jgi:GR25 family glycosyltransferase involved in LPS biosynthesis
MIDKIYIIHYTKLPERKDKISSYIEKMGIPYEFICDFDKEQIDEFRNSYHNMDINLYRQKVEIYRNFRYGAPNLKNLSESEISCATKHITAIGKIIEECDTALILEDDAIPYNMDFFNNIKTSIEEAPKKWGAIFIGNGCGDDFIRGVNKIKITETLFKVNHPASNCAEAYILNKKSAKKIYNRIVPFQIPFDCEIACCMGLEDIDVYWRIPSLFYQGSINGEFKSSLR